MNPPTDRSSRAVRIVALLVGIVLIVYALSDHPLYGGEPGFGRVQWVIAAAGGAATLAALSSRWAARSLMVLVPSLAMLGIGDVLGEWLLGPAQRPIYQADDRLIFKFIPDRVSAMKRLPVNGGETVVHRINRDGFRGPELQLAGTATRVVVYGDSFIHAAYSADSETLPAVPGSWWRASSARMQACPASSPGARSRWEVGSTGKFNSASPGGPSRKPGARPTCRTSALPLRLC